MTPTLTILIRSAAVLVSALALQASVLAHLRVALVEVGLLMALSVAAGLVGGPQRGALVGFCAGSLADLVTTTPFGLSALVAALVGYAVGAMTADRARRPGPWSVAVGAAGAAVATLAFAAIGELVGRPMLSSPDLLRIVAVQTVFGALAVPVLAGLWRLVWRTPLEDRLLVR